MKTQQRPPLASRVEAYLSAVMSVCAERGDAVSLVLFGSAATGGYSESVSDVDLLIVLRDCASPEDRRRVYDAVSQLETYHGVAKPRLHPPTALEAFADRINANVHPFFVCTRADLLSGNPGRIFGIPRAQAVFVDRVAIPSCIASGKTIWGEDLLAQVLLPPIRRFDVGKAFHPLFTQMLFAAILYPMLPDATKYAMDILKRSVHNCYFCYHLRAAPLAEEVAFFQDRHGPSRALAQLIALRREYHPSFKFVVSCLPALARLHWRTARQNQFPREAR